MSAFTLAEVLITLTVLGVIAAITIPSIIRNFQDRAQFTGVKRAYALFSNAFRQMAVVEGQLHTWDWPETGKEDYLHEKLDKYLAHEKYCGSDNGCFLYGWTASGQKWKVGSGTPFFKTIAGNSGVSGNWTEANGSGKSVLKNGMTYSYSINNPTGYVGNCKQLIAPSSNLCGNVGNIYIDINGPKGPNRKGYDVFQFAYYVDGDVRPWNKKRGEQFSGEKYGAESCSIDTDNSTGCAYWIIKHNNMDYKYREVGDEW